MCVLALLACLLSTAADLLETVQRSHMVLTKLRTLAADALGRTLDCVVSAAVTGMPSTLFACSCCRYLYSTFIVELQHLKPSLNTWSFSLTTGPKYDMHCCTCNNETCS